MWKIPGRNAEPSGSGLVAFRLMSLYSDRCQTSGAPSGHCHIDLRKFEMVSCTGTPVERGDLIILLLPCKKACILCSTSPFPMDFDGPHFVLRSYLRKWLAGVADLAGLSSLDDQCRSSSSYRSRIPAPFAAHPNSSQSCNRDSY